MSSCLLPRLCFLLIMCTCTPVGYYWMSLKLKNKDALEEQNSPEVRVHQPGLGVQVSQHLLSDLALQRLP